MSPRLRLIAAGEAWKRAKTVAESVEMPMEKGVPSTPEAGLVPTGSSTFSAHRSGWSGTPKR